MTKLLSGLFTNFFANLLNIKSLLLLCITVLALSSCSSDKTAKTNDQIKAPYKIKMVIITMFEIGEDEGDKAGEFQLWKAGQKLDKTLDFPHSHHPIMLNEEKGVLGIVTGMGIAKATAAVMALGLDERFDLSQAYWLVAGIAGIDPHDASIGSAVWAEYLVDGDLAHQIDAREIPEEWSTGYFPLFANAPYPSNTEINTELDPNGVVYRLNPELSEWAYQLTKGIQLEDSPALQNLREKYEGYPNAVLPPFVLKGDHLAASTFWHGELLNQWANDWTAFWTKQAGNFVTSGMEDTGTFQALIYLDRINKVDKNRVMVLRTGSNYSMQPPGLTAAENLAMESGEDGFAGLQSSIESAYIVGSTVVEEIVSNWGSYASTKPTVSE